MPATSTSAPATKRGPGRPRKASPVTFQQAVEPPPREPEQPVVRQIDGVDVVDIVPVAPLGPDKPMRIVKIHLADGTVMHGCRDCPDELDFVGTRGDVMAHRNAVHGARFGKARVKVTAVQQELPEILDAVLSPRSDDKPSPDSVYEMTVAELISLMPSISALGDLVEKVERERDDFLHELNSFRAFEKQNRAKLDAFDELRDEIVTLRQQMRQWGNYEQVKAEMYELRIWKKKMISRLKGLGFQLSEEEQ